MWKITLDDIVSVLQRKGYMIEVHQIEEKKRNKIKQYKVYYAHLPNVVYGFRRYSHENTAEAVFSKILGERTLTKEDLLNSL